MGKPTEPAELIDVKSHELKSAEYTKLANEQLALALTAATKAVPVPDVPDTVGDALIVTWFL